MSTILTAEQLAKIMPYAGPRTIECVGALNQAMEPFGIDTPKRIAHFLGQIAHESAQLAATRENFNYSAEQLMRVWPRRFLSIEHANGFAHLPQQIANFVYANRGGNGDMASGDGWRYRGAGYLQHTFKTNHAAIGQQFGVPLEKVGDWLATPRGAAMAAAWLWSRNGCNALADSGDVDAISDIINLGHHTETQGDAIGFAGRLSFTNKALVVMGVTQ